MNRSASLGTCAITSLRKGVLMRRTLRTSTLLSMPLGLLFTGLAHAQDPASSAATPGEGLDKALVSLRDTLQKVDAIREQLKKADDPLSKGNLVRFGLTGGLALTLQVTSGKPLDSKSLYGASVTGIPYIMLHPGYLRNDIHEPNRVYCASRWQGHSINDASAEAKEAAMDHARKGFNAAMDWFASGLADVVDCNPCDPTKSPTCKDLADQADSKRSRSKNTVCKRFFLDDRDLKVIKEIAQKQKDKTDDPATTKQKTDAIIAVIAQRYWNNRIDTASCTKYHFGPWIGLSGIPYYAQVQSFDKGGAETSRDNRLITPVVAGGLGWSPNVYFSVLLGVTYSLSLEGKADGSNAVYHMLTPTIGIGGSIDIFTALAKR